ncbi:MAG TPA: DUF4129 domain-containing protein [Jatrophihabitans sp.]|uniref:DUF4129 domain-containing protein n=1 Tax=Jatrophihabitans sp. TaxID=1932789 RepID=UPI002F2310B7
MRFNAGNGGLAAAALAGFLLVGLAARAEPEQSGAPSAVRSGGPREAATTAVPQPDQWTTPPPEATGDFRVPWSLIQWVLLGALLLAVLGLAVVLGPRLIAWLRSRRAASRTARPVEPAREEVLRRVPDRLRAPVTDVAQGQIRDGVILCWHRLEQAAEAAGLPRLPSETSSDLAERLLSTLPLSQAPLDRLAALYREARFSSHPIPAEAVTQARADLARLRSELEAARAAGPPVRAGHD